MRNLRGGVGYTSLLLGRGLLMLFVVVAVMTASFGSLTKVEGFNIEEDKELWNAVTEAVEDGYDSVV